MCLNKDYVLLQIHSLVVYLGVWHLQTFWGYKHLYCVWIDRYISLIFSNVFFAAAGFASKKRTIVKLWLGYFMRVDSMCFVEKLRYLVNLKYLSFFLLSFVIKYKWLQFLTTDISSNLKLISLLSCMAYPFHIDYKHKTGTCNNYC